MKSVNGPNFPVAPPIGLAKSIYYFVILHGMSEDQHEPFTVF